MARRAFSLLVLTLVHAGAAWAGEDVPTRGAVRDEVAAPRLDRTRRVVPVRRCVPEILPRRYWYECYFRPRRPGDRASLLTASGIAVGSGLVLTSGNRDAVLTSSDVGQWGLPAVGLLVPLAHRDLRSAAQFGLVMGLAAGLTELGKRAIDKRRPPGNQGESYPSGHTAPAFASAAFLYERYGPRYGIPAYVLAIHTGVARVVADKHFLDDVIAGAGIGVLSAGLAEELLRGRCKSPTPFCWRPLWRYEFGFGAFRQGENDVRAPAGGGTELDLAGLDDWTDPRATARLAVEWFPSAHDEVMFRVDPADIRTRPTPASAISFGGAVFPAGTPLVARWRGNEYRLRWRRDLLPRNRCLALRAGGSLVFVENGVALESAAMRASVTSLRVAPCPHVALEYEILPGLTLSLLGEGVPGVSFFGFDLEAALRYRITRRWDAGVTCRWWTRPLDDSRLEDDAITRALFLTIGRSF